MQPYQLWSTIRSAWCEYELTAEAEHIPAIRRLFDGDWSEGSRTATPDVALIPEPNCPRGEWSISVRAEGRTIGYLAPSDARNWARVVRRVIASGFAPTTSSRIWANEYDGWDHLEFNTDVHIKLGDPALALPINNPPTDPYTMLPRSSIIQVTKEELYTDTLLKFVPDGGTGVLFATLHEHAPTGRAKPHVEVRINDECVGQLTPQMSQRFLPMIRCLQDRGLVATCWGDLTGSTIAAEVRIDAVKANEADNDVLYGDPVEISPLIPALSDPGHYDLSPAAELLDPLPPILPVPREIPAEPPDGSLIRFTKGNGRYLYVSVRRADHWETTATGDWGSINELMPWERLATRLRGFDLVTAWSPVDPHDDARLREQGAVIRFTINGLYLAAINIANDFRHDGDWYTTISDDAEERLPFGDRASWSQISRAGRYIDIATRWQSIPAP